MSEETKPESGLTDQQQIFAEAYLTCWNATKAAKAAGYTEESARQQGYRLLTNAYIQAYISDRLNAAAMPANEVLARLTRQARSDIADVLNEEGNFDFGRAVENDATHMIISLTPNEFGTAVKLASSQQALQQLAKLHGLEKTLVEHSFAGFSNDDLIAEAKVLLAGIAAPGIDRDAATDKEP